MVMKKFTVIGFYDDTQQVSVQFVVAESADDAYYVAAKNKYETLTFVAVISGHHKAESQNESIAPSADYRRT